MSIIKDLDRSIIAIFDIGGFTKNGPIKQAQIIDNFVNMLSSELAPLQSLSPDVFSTGDGAIVTIGRNHEFKREDAKKFFDFVISFLSKMHHSECVLRASVNYSEYDKIIIIDHLNTMQGSYIQIGDTINLASRIITFAELGEILVNESVHQLFDRIGLLDEYDFVENESLITKHGDKLETYSYAPKSDEFQHFYDPTLPEHKYKKYKYFPSVGGETVRKFLKTGLDYDLDKIISYAFDSIKDIDTRSHFLSYSPVMDVLTQLNYDPEDKVYVLNREDRKTTFWTQIMKDRYVRYLKSHAKKHGGVINQMRLRVYNHTHPDDLMPVKDTAWEVWKLHAPHTYFNTPSNTLFKFGRLKELIFGVTISTRHKFAIIPIPNPEAMDEQLHSIQNIGYTLNLLENYKPDHGPMKAIISADENYVSELISEFEGIIKHAETAELKKENFPE